MKFIGIIPARYASTRFPGKPLADLGGKPMIQWVYENTLQSLDNVIVATDHPDIESAVNGFGGKVIMTSPEHPSGTDRCAEVIDILSKQGEEYDVALNIQGDEPFIRNTHLSLLKQTFDLENTQIATLANVIEDPEELFDPNVVKIVTGKGGKALYFSRSPMPHQRDRPQSEWYNNFKYLKHLGMYAYRTDILREITKLKRSPLEQAESLEQLRWLESGYRIRVHYTTEVSMGIDTPEDLEKARKIISSRPG
ncbi:MAG TPA: 3-deoxy-manno-octulosonate cytidylyltransferase [Bacteroides sp.]|nr:3-deoxy-manno-octulosonate cytidylyltransferase [Bacteroides sp.]